MALSDAQKKLRLLIVGGSEISALLGLSKYGTPITVFGSKRADIVTAEAIDNHHTRRGTFLEGGVAAWGAHDFRAELRQVGTLRHPSIPHVGCTPDYLATPDGGEEEDWSIKVPGPRAFEEWGDSGTDEVPAHAYAQLQYELITVRALFGVERGRILAPVDGELRVYPVAPDEEFQSLCIEAVARFWRFVETGTPPPPDASAAYDSYLKRRFPKDVGALMPADEECERWSRLYRDAKEQVALYEKQESLARQYLETAIGEAQGMVGEGWKVSWRQTKGREYTDWDAVCAEANVPPAVIEKHTRRVPIRAFRLTDSATRRKKGQPSLVEGAPHVRSLGAVQSGEHSSGDGVGDDAVEVGADSSGASGETR